MYYYYYYLSRNIFKYLSERDETQNLWKAMESGRYVSRIGSLENKALPAYNTSLDVINKEKDRSSIAK